MTVLTARVGRYPHTAALFDAPVALTDDDTLAVELGGTPASTRPMLERLAFDVCEMPLVNYLVAKERGLAATALPVFTTRRFPHGMLIWNRAAGVERAPDLEGRAVGVPYLGNTDVVWVRGLLESAYGVDTDAITWIATLDEPVAPHRVPGNLRQELGADLEAMLLDGQLAGLVQGRGQTLFGDGIECLVPDLARAEQAWFERTGLFPVLFTIVLRDAAVARRPELGAAVFAAFAQAKRQRYDALRAGEALSPDELPTAAVSGFPADPGRAYLGPNPLRYGLDANRDAIEALVGFAAMQQIIGTRPAAEEVFLAHEEPDDHAADRRRPRTQGTTT